MMRLKQASDEQREKRRGKQGAAANLLSGLFIDFRERGKALVSIDSNIRSLSNKESGEYSAVLLQRNGREAERVNRLGEETYIFHVRNFQMHATYCIEHI